MVRGRGYPRGSSYRGGSRGGGGGGYQGSSPRFSSSFSPDPRDRYHSDRFGGGRSSYADDYHRSYRSESSYLGRDSGRRSPDRKRLRAEASSSRYESSYSGYGSSRHEPPPPPSFSERSGRGYSAERHGSSAPYSRREDFRRLSGPPSRGSYRGRISTRGSRGLRFRDRPIRRRLIDSSYAIRKRALARSSIIGRRLKMSRRSALLKKKDSSKEDKSKVKEEPGEEKDEEKSQKDGKDESGKAEGNNEESFEDKIKKKKNFVKLACPHCNVKCLTFRRYEVHLSSRSHLFTLRKVASKQKSLLAQMRAAQRNTQNELEKSSDDLTDSTNFCPLCKLNYKQKKAVHQLSEAHKNLKKFLIPTCKICNITFKSPMGYEVHLCSIRHIKRKQLVENAGDASGEDDNLEMFTTIDSVGDGDGSEGGEKDDKDAINVGLEKIRKIEVHYCDMCKMYLPRGDETEMPDILSRHCKQKVHFKRYARLKEKEALEQRALKKQQEEAKEVPMENGDAEGGDDKADDTTKEDEDAREDKIWADVDKDLGDILAEAESANKSSDEDEEDSHVNGERYDRFKLSINDGAVEPKEVEEK